MRTIFTCLVLSSSVSALALNRPELPSSATLGDKLSDETPAQLSVSLRIENQAGLKQLIADQTNPNSSDYHQWLTPQSFAERFGLSAADYEHVATWLEAAGFTVTRWPNRIYLTATGKVKHVNKLLGVESHAVTQWGKVFRTYVGTPVLPADIDSRILAIGGLDTRHRWHHKTPATRIVDAQSETGYAFGAADFRAFYDFAGYFTANASTGTVETAVIATQTTADGNAGTLTPPTASLINEYITSISQGGVTYNPITLTNSASSYDTSDFNTEYELDAEMQSVGAANLSKINMVLAPSATVFTDAPNYIVNTLSNVVTASASIGICEPELSESDLEGTTTQSLLDQGLTEGITWFAAAGDEGAYDCYQPPDEISVPHRGGSNGGSSGGSSGGSASVDWPCSMPEIVCMGGTQLDSDPTSIWSGPGSTLTGYLTEDSWNEYTTYQGGAGGGGASTLYTKPTWQTGYTPSDGQRDVPDLALQAATYVPGVALYADGEGSSSSGGLTVVGGTSVASPLGAGLFALLASQKGCTSSASGTHSYGLGDIHSLLYTLGGSQLDGGAASFHDITSGNNTLDGVTGFSAAPGYDQASGWGSLDVAKLIANWPSSCSGTTATSTSTGTTTGTGATTSSSSGTSGSSSGGVCKQATATINNGDIGAACSGQGSCASGETCEDLFGDGIERCALSCAGSVTCPGNSSCQSFGSVSYCVATCELSAGACPGSMACNPWSSPDPSEYGLCFPNCQTYACPGAETCNSAGACLCTTDSDCGSGSTCDPNSGACYTACSSGSCAAGCCATEGSINYCDAYGTVVASTGTTAASGTGTTAASGTGTTSGAGTGTSGATVGSSSGQSSNTSGAVASGAGSSGSGTHGATTSGSAAASGAGSGATTGSSSGGGSTGTVTATNGGTTFSTNGGGGSGGCSTGGGAMSMLSLLGLVALGRRRKR